MKQKQNKETAITVPLMDKVTQAEKDVEALVPIAETLQSLEMTSEEDYEILLTEARVVRDMERRVTKDRDGATKKLQEEMNNTKTMIKGWFAPVLKVCQNILALVEEKRRKYDLFLVEKQRKEQERLDAEAAKEQKRLEKNAKARAQRAPSKMQAKDILASVPEVEATQAGEEKAPKVSGATVAKVWDYEIVNANDVPEYTEKNGGEWQVFSLWERKFSRADLLNARKALATSDQDQPVPGVRFFQKDSSRYGRL